MDVGLVVIAFLLVGLPLLAFGFASRLPPPRRRPIKPDALLELARRHRLSGLDVWRVQQAVAEGVRAEPARLREPAVAFAELVLAQNPRGRAGLGRRPLLRRALVVAYGLVAVAVLVKDPAMIGTVFVGALAAGLRVQQKRAARRAIQANAAAHDDVAADVDASSG